MKVIEEIVKNSKFRNICLGIDGGMGLAYFDKKSFTVVFSNGLGWDHVSVSMPDRCPTWEEMCIIKDIFFDEEDTVVQYHPSKSIYQNMAKYCLHLWKSQKEDFITPPINLV